MDYIMQTAQGIKVHTGVKIIEYDKSINKFLNEQLYAELTTLSGRKEALKQLFKLKNNIPIYIDNNTCLFESHHHRDLDNVFINANQVIAVQSEGEQTLITFKQFHTLKVNKPCRKLMKKWKATKAIMKRIELM